MMTTLISTRYVEVNLSAKWGGLYIGSEFNFLIVGHDNPMNSDVVEVIRVIKYDKDWNELDHTGLTDVNTSFPFSHGSVRCAECDGMLYIHTSHSMYNQHQANMTIEIRQSDMAVTDVQCYESNLTGYVSHSFDQFIIIDQTKNIVIFDHGDAYPRSAFLQRFTEKAGNETFEGSLLNHSKGIDIQRFPGKVGENRTGASLAGLAETANKYVPHTTIMESAMSMMRAVTKSAICISRLPRRTTLHKLVLQCSKSPITMKLEQPARAAV